MARMMMSVLLLVAVVAGVNAMHTVPDLIPQSYVGRWYQVRVE